MLSQIIAYLNCFLGLPVLAAGLFSCRGVLVNKDVAKVVVIIHGPDFNGHTPNLANILERLLVEEVVWVCDLCRRPGPLHNRLRVSEAVMLTASVAYLPEQPQ